MKIEYLGAETEAQTRARYLKETMLIRKVTTKDLSFMTGVSDRTLSRYMNGRTDPADAAGITIAKICYVLGMNVYTLGGVDEVKPGMAFKNDGQKMAVREYGLPLYSMLAVRDVLRWYMRRGGMKKRAELAEVMGLPERVVYDVLSLQTDARKMHARTIFGACRRMVFHPYFLYGFRDISEYEGYRRAYEDMRRKKQEQSEIMKEAEEIYRRRAAENSAGTE